MRPMQNLEAILHHVAMHTGEPIRLVRAVRDFNLRGRSRDHQLQRFLEIHEAIADVEPPQTLQHPADPVLRLWRIRRSFPPATFPRADLELRPLGYGHRLMAAGLLTYWNGHPIEHQLHRALLPEILGKRHGTRYGPKHRSAAWRSLFEIASPILFEIPGSVFGVPHRFEDWESFVSFGRNNAEDMERGKWRFHAIEAPSRSSLQGRLTAETVGPVQLHGQSG